MFVPIGDRHAAAKAIHDQAVKLNAYVGVAPRVREAGTAEDVERVWSLWVDLDDAAGLERLARFCPLPSIVIRTGGGGGHAYWPLKAPVEGAWAQRSNRRLARRLGADMAATDPARILRPAGTMNHKYDPARAVVCTRLELDMFTIDQVVGKLPDSDHYMPRRTVGDRIAPADPSRLLAGIARTVGEAQVGNRNEALFWAACRVAEHADDLDQTTALDDLRAAAAQAGLGDSEIERTIQSAAKAA